MGAYESAPPGGAPPPVPPPDIPTYLVWSILTTLFCCMPFGVVSIVYAAQVDSLRYSGRIAEAWNASAKAKQWATWSALSMVIVYALIALFYGGMILLAVFGSAAMSNQIPMPPPLPIVPSAP